METIDITWNDKDVTVFGEFVAGQVNIPFKMEGIAPRFDIEKVMYKYKELDLIISEYEEIEQLIINLKSL
jgi:hypothetical protein